MPAWGSALATHPSALAPHGRLANREIVRQRVIASTKGLGVSPRCSSLPTSSTLDTQPIMPIRDSVRGFQQKIAKEVNEATENLTKRQKAKRTHTEHFQQPKERA
ncbi:hypothetical protein FRC08_009242, partial [Ceratobasidium sp. 394]